MAEDPCLVFQAKNIACEFQYMYFVKYYDDTLNNDFLWAVY